MPTYKVEFSDLGEGYNGDYNEDDPSDVSLLRLDILVHPSHEMAETGYSSLDDEWVPMRRGSYCTYVPHYTPVAEQQRLLRVAEELLVRATPPHGNINASRAARSLKRVAETLSWMEPGSTLMGLEKQIREMEL